MPLTRRDFLASSASLAGLVATSRLGFGQSGPVGVPAEFKPKSAATADFLKSIGPVQAAELLKRLQKTNSDIKLKGLKTIRGVPNAGGNLLTGYPYTEFYDWDLYFENLYLGYYGVSLYCHTNLKLFLSRQQADGYVNRSLNKQRDRQHFKPFLAQLVVLGARQNGNDYQWLNTSPETATVPANGSYYNRLKKYLDKWFSYDGDHNGLPAWNSADAAGTDNQWSRAGQLGAFEDEGVDLASYLVRELRAMAVIAGHLGQKDDGMAFTAHADQVCKLINDVFWDEQDGIYYDRNEKKGELVRVKSATCFMPLFCGAATPERAKRTINERLLNEREFWLAYPVASYAKTEPDYYQGSHNECNWRGSTWAPTNYMIFQGLMRYGHADVAKELATRLFTMAVVKNPVLREYYNAEDGSGLGQVQFWGFTALYYVMLLECHLKHDISDLEQPFRPIIPEELGINYDAGPGGLTAV
jgi:putative isomerase